MLSEVIYPPDDIRHHIGWQGTGLAWAKTREALGFIQGLKRQVNAYVGPEGPGWEAARGIVEVVGLCTRTGDATAFVCEDGIIDRNDLAWITLALEHRRAKRGLQPLPDLTAKQAAAWADQIAKFLAEATGVEPDFFAFGPLPQDPTAARPGSATGKKVAAVVAVGALATFLALR